MIFSFSHHSAKKAAGLALSLLIANTALFSAQGKLDKKAIPRPTASTPASLKATPVTVGKAKPVTADKATPITTAKAKPVMKATPIEIDPDAKNKEGEGPLLEDQLTYANLLFSHKQYAIAIRQYELFLKDHPQSPNAASAAFRMAECYLKLPQLVQAKQTYRQLIEQYKEGVYAGSAAFRLATLYFNEKNYSKAIPYFEIAEQHIDNAKLQLQCLYYRARCLQLTQKKHAAVALYEQLMNAQGQGSNNPFAAPTRAAIAHLYVELEDHKKSLTAFKNIIAHSKDPAQLDEAYARAGLIAAKLGKREESNQMLDKVLSNKSGKTWKALAQIGLIFNQFSAADYAGVIQSYSRGIYDAPADSRAQMLLLVAHSYRLTKDLKQAAKVYGIVERNYRDRSEGIEAGYRRLQCLHLLNDGGLAVLAARYVEQQQKIDSSSKFIDLALLMKAEWNFEHNEYAEAAKAYGAIRPENIPQEYLVARLYKLGWSQVEAGQVEDGISTLTKFIDSYPKDALTPSTLAKRASTYQATEDAQRALKDYQTLASQYSSSNELEFALQQIAVIQLALKDSPAMVTAFLELLKKFPKTSAEAEANFWIGSGYIQQKKYRLAIPFLNKARQLDEKTYYEVATRRIILASYQLEDLKALSKESESFLSSKRKLTIPVPIFTYLGIKLYEEGQYEAAARFLSLASTPNSPEQSRPEVWNYLGQAKLKLKHYEQAVAPFDFYLKFIQRPALRAKTHINKGRAQLGLKQFEQAKESANEALRLQKEGRINATARMLLGDIAFDKGDAQGAAKLYLIVSQIFVDPIITPLALNKAAMAFEKSGQPAKAKQLRAKLKESYPAFDAGE